MIAAFCTLCSLQAQQAATYTLKVGEKVIFSDVPAFNLTTSLTSELQSEIITKDATVTGILASVVVPNKAIKINLNNMLKTGNLKDNLELKEGDILYLTKNGRIDFARDIVPFLSGAYMISEIRDNND